MTGKQNVIPAERVSLPAHVDMCATRYASLDARLKRVEYLIYALFAILLFGEGTVVEVVKRLVGK